MKEEQSTLKCWHASQLRRPFSLSSRSGMSAPPLCVWLLPALFYSLPIILRSLSLSLLWTILCQEEFLGFAWIILNLFRPFSIAAHCSAIVAEKVVEKCNACAKAFGQPKDTRRTATVQASVLPSSDNIFAGVKECKQYDCFQKLRTLSMHGWTPKYTKTTANGCSSHQK